MTLETERLLLRPFGEGDAADVLEYLREPAVHCFACMKLDDLDADGNPIYEDTYQYAILKMEWKNR